MPPHKGGRVVAREGEGSQERGWCVTTMALPLCHHAQYQNLVLTARIFEIARSLGCTKPCGEVVVFEVLHTAQSSYFRFDLEDWFELRLRPRAARRRGNDDEGGVRHRRGVVEFRLARFALNGAAKKL